MVSAQSGDSLSRMSRPAHPPETGGSTADLVVVADWIVGRRRLAVHPDLRPRDDRRELLAISRAGRLEHLAHIRARNGGATGARSLTGRCEEAKHSHRRQHSYGAVMARDGDTSATMLLLVRHGESTWNAEGRWQGHANPPLSALGRAQAIAAATTVPPVDVVVTSNLDRAHETGRLIADAIRVPVSVEEELHERDIGAWTGLTRDEIEAGWPGGIENGHRPDGWESDARVAARGMDVLRRIAKAHSGQRVLVVTHGGLIRAIERELAIDSPHLANLGGLWIEVVGDEIAVLDRVELIDHTAVAATVPESE